VTRCWLQATLFGTAVKAPVHNDWQYGLVAKKSFLMGVVAWFVIRSEHKVGNQAAEHDLVTQLRYRYLSSLEYAAYQLGVFDE
jgi:hypothetical protein